MYLLLITGIAIFIRSIPAWTNAAWGCDFGIYYGLTNSFVKSGELFAPYTGWGNSYEYFPVLYAITGLVHWITGIDVLVIMPKLAPIFGGLTIFIFYFLINELLKNRKIALLSSLFLAVMPFHVYQTSHASPLTMGHFFFMLSLFIFVKYRTKTIYLIPLLISTILLVMSHHLTTYFYMLTLVFIIFFENAGAKQWTPSVKKDVLYVLIASGIVFSYWAIIAQPVYKMFMRYGLTIGPVSLGANGTILVFYVLFFSLFGIIWLKRKLRLFQSKNPLRFRQHLLRFIVTICICFSAMIAFTLVKMPWTNFSFTVLSIVYATPLVLMIGLGVAGFRSTRFIPNGYFIRGWLLAISASFVYALMTNSAILFPHRHLEYIMASLSVIAVYGLRGLVDHADFSSGLRQKISDVQFSWEWNIEKIKEQVMHNRQLVFVAIVLILVTTNAVSVYPSHVALNASYESITDENLAVIDWMSKNLDRNTTVIASDHRLARIAEANGFNTTLDDASMIWSTENLTDYIEELTGQDKKYSRITHVIIDDIMRERVVHVGFANIEYMTNESYDKFAPPLFTSIYRNATVNEDLEEIHWTELYEVNWTYLNYERRNESTLISKIWFP